MKLIIGSSGYIGRKLFEYFQKKGKSVVGTYYRNPREGLKYFDLENPDLSKLGLDLKQVDRIIIASGITNLNECQRYPEKAHRINVEGTKRLVEQSLQRGIIPVFLSSDCVFDGKKGDYKESDTTNPCNTYGMHKKTIEDFLLQTRGDFLIVRLSKIFGLSSGDKTILTSWAEQLNKGESIRCARDQRISPTYINDLISVLDIAMQRNLRGLYNLASPESFNRLELAMMLKSELGIKTGKIIPCFLRELDLPYVLALDISMNSEKIQGDTGFKFTSMKNCLKKLESTLDFHFS